MTSAIGTAWPASRVQIVFQRINEHFSSVLHYEDIRSFRQAHGLTKGYILYLDTKKQWPGLYIKH
jgi:hypothetical protein